MSDDERAQFARNCKPGCPGPELLEVARGGHDCDTAIARAWSVPADPYDVAELESQLERARSTAARLEDRLARVELRVREAVDSPSDDEAVLAEQLLEIVTGADVERVEAIAALAAEPVPW